MAYERQKSGSNEIYGTKNFKHVDHTLLKATADWASIQQLVEEAVEFETASICIPPSYVKPVFENTAKK